MKTATIALLILLAASAAAAGVNTDKPLGPMNLYIDGDGGGTMVNDGDGPFSFDGYTVASADGLIENDAWKGIGHWPGDPPIIWPCIYPPFPPFPPMPPFPPFPPFDWDWVTLSDTPTLISEASLSSYMTLASGGSIDLGAAFPGGTQADLTFTYVNSAAQGSYEGRVIPEPTAIALLALGAVAAGRRRRGIAIS